MLQKQKNFLNSVKHKENIEMELKFLLRTATIVLKYGYNVKVVDFDHIKKNNRII